MIIAVLLPKTLMFMAAIVRKRILQAKRPVVIVDGISQVAPMYFRRCNRNTKVIVASSATDFMRHELIRAAPDLVVFYNVVDDDGDEELIKELNGMGVDVLIVAQTCHERCSPVRMATVMHAPESCCSKFRIRNDEATLYPLSDMEPLRGNGEFVHRC
jgi:hypothetical protein